MARPTKRERVSFAKLPSVVPIPNLIEIQKESYERFLQMNLLHSERSESGLQGVFKSIFPISDYRDNCSLEFVSYTIGVWECACGRLSGLQNTRYSCGTCGKPLPPREENGPEVNCTEPDCGKEPPVYPPICESCGTRVGLKHKYSVEECIERWNHSFHLPYFRPTKEFRIDISEISLLYTLLCFYRGRQLAQHTIGASGTWGGSWDNIDTARALLAIAARAFPENHIIRMYLGERRTRTPFN